jgi:hypothetical protein
MLQRRADQPGRDWQAWLVYSILAFIVSTFLVFGVIAAVHWSARYDFVYDHGTYVMVDKR